MSVLLEIQKQLGTIQHRIVTLERALSEHPGLPSIIANLESATRIQQKLTAQFSEQAAKSGYDVCKYRAFDELDRPKAGPAFEAVASFQKVVSVVYAALKYGVKQRATIPDNVASETTFGFGYAFQGSVEVVLTLRKDTLPGMQMAMDESIEAIFSMVKSSTAESVRAYAQRLGPGAINALYEWAEDSAANGLGADIEWRGRDAVAPQKIVLQRQEFHRLSETIESTSSESEVTTTLDGILTAADSTKKRFKFKSMGLPEIRGTIAEGVIDAEHEARLPAPYKARIKKTTRTKYSTGVEEVRYHLIKLDKPDDGRKAN